MTPPRQRRKVLGGALRFVRESHKLTQAQLAQKCNELRLNDTSRDDEEKQPVSHTTISHIESGRDRYVSTQLMVDLAEVLECDLGTITYLANVYEVRAGEAA